jgi:hypothetical protein
MVQSLAKDRRIQRGVDADIVRVGKDVIEILTTGMYVAPVTIFREYIQNAADSVDVARAQGLFGAEERGSVSVAFDHATRSVSIRDNGAGLSARDALPVLLAIGGSQKRETGARGFRGVGRLSGLAYCRELEFRTKVAGEDTIVSVVWDCRALRERLADAAFGGDLKRIVSDVVSVWREPAEIRAEHFFEVHLREITRLRNDVLLNERVVGHFLAQVSPVPFAADFSFASLIQEQLSKYRRQVPINLTVAGETLYRPFHDELALPGTSHMLRIEDVELLEFPDVDGKTGAVGWIAHHEYVRSLPVALGVRGLRARFGDLQVGDSNLFDDSFKEPRFNGWSVGEIHVIDRRIVPNVRRDNFETNHHYYNLLVQLGPLAGKITHRCRSASVSRNAGQVAKNIVEEVEARLKQKRPFDRAELSRLRSGLLRALEKLKRIANTKEREGLARKLEHLRSKLAKRAPKRGAAAVGVDEATSLITKFVTNREQRQKLIEELRKLCK